MYVVFEVVWKYLGAPFVWFLKWFERISYTICVLFWSSLKQSLGAFGFVFEVVWKNLGEYFGFIFEVVWKNLGTRLVLFLK